MLQDEKQLFKVFTNTLNDEKATDDERMEALTDYVSVVSQKNVDKVKQEFEELKNVTDENILQARGIHVLTSEEKTFYNEEIIKTKGDLKGDVLFPVTIIERIFDDIKKDRPLLNLINFGVSSAVTRVIRTRRKGKAVFGPLHKDLEGQLDFEFGVTEFTQLALTAFFLISNDLIDLGARWIDRYVRLCLSEAIAEAWEENLITGDGKDKPIGLMKDLDASVTGGVYSDKKSAGTLTFKDAPTMVSEFSNIMKGLSKYKLKLNPDDKNPEDVYRKVSGNVYLIVNPSNYYDIVARVTTQNANGVFVSNLPFIAQDHIIESTFVPENKLIAFVGGEYDATMSRAEKIYVYKETFAMKRATLYAVDMLANGQPSNNYASQVYDIKLATPTEAKPQQ